MLIVGGIFTLQFFIGYLLFLTFIPLMFYKSGFEFDTNKKQFRNFFSIAGKSRGSWKSYVNCTSISLKKKRRGMKQYAPRSNNSKINYTTFYEVVLIGSDKRNYKVLYATKELEEAKKIVEDCCENLGLPYSQFGK